MMEPKLMSVSVNISNMKNVLIAVLKKLLSTYNELNSLLAK